MRFRAEVIVEREAPVHQTKREVEFDAASRDAAWCLLPTVVKDVGYSAYSLMSVRSLEEMPNG
jgi:hypothetical protein